MTTCHSSGMDSDQVPDALLPGSILNSLHLRVVLVDQLLVFTSSVN